MGKPVKIRCELSDKGISVGLNKRNTDRKGYILMETNRFYRVQWDGTKYLQSYAKAYIKQIPDE